MTEKGYMIMAHIMNHREIEHFAKKFWLENGTDEMSYRQILSGSDDAMKMMNWVEDTYEKVAHPDLIMDYGIDCLRCYLLFEKTPQENDIYFDSWDEGALEGVYKFVSKYRRMIQMALEANRHGKYVNDDFEELVSYVDIMQYEILSCMEKENSLANRHSALSVLMEGFKKIQKHLRITEMSVKEHEYEIQDAMPLSEKNVVHKDAVNEALIEENQVLFELCKKIVLLAAPFMPYISEELWQQIAIYESHDTEQLKKWYHLHTQNSVHNHIWNIGDIKKRLNIKMIDIPVQIQSKTKKVLHVNEKMAKEELVLLAQNEVSNALQEMGQYKIIYVEGKLINFVR